VFASHFLTHFALQNGHLTATLHMRPFAEDVGVAGVLCVPLLSRNKVKILGAVQVMARASSKSFN